MSDKVDGMGVCQNNPEGNRNHEWRRALEYQVNPEPPKIQGAPPTGPVRVFTRYYCIYCLENRDKEVPTPINAPIVINNQVLLAAQPSPSGLRVN